MHDLGGVVAQSSGNKHFLSKKCQNRWFWGNYSSFTMHGVNNVVLSNTVLGLNYILVLFGPAYKKYVHKKSNSEVAPKHLYGPRCSSKMF